MHAMHRVHRPQAFASPAVLLVNVPCLPELHLASFRAWLCVCVGCDARQWYAMQGMPVAAVVMFLLLFGLRIVYARVVKGQRKNLTASAPALVC